jgi:hypothetical protein
MAALLAKKPEQRPTSAAVVHEELCTIEQEIASMEGIEATGVGGRSRSGVRPVLPPPDLPPLPETPEEAREQPVEGDVQAAAQAKPAPEAPPPPVPTPVGPPTSREMRRGGRGVFATTEKDAWQITMTGRRSMFLLIAAGLAVVVLAILLIANMSRDTGPGSVVDAGAVASRPDVEAAVPPAVAAQQVDNAEANSAAQDTAPAAADVVKAPVEEVVRRVTIESVPPGAVVSLAGRRRPEGRTPVTVEIEPGKAVRAQLSLGGYHGATVVLAPEGPDRYTVRLNRVDIVVPF